MHASSVRVRLIVIRANTWPSGHLCWLITYDGVSLPSIPLPGGPQPTGALPVNHEYNQVIDAATGADLVDFDYQ